MLNFTLDFNKLFIIFLLQNNKEIDAGFDK
jgi:hypothetical protein